MVSTANEVGSTARAAQNAAESTLSELRESVSAIAKEVADITEKRTRAARDAAVDAAEAGATELRRNIRNQPVIAMGIAAAAGAALALMFVPRAHGHRSHRHSAWDRLTPNITRADLHDFADNIQRSVARAAHSASSPIAPTFERLVDAISRTDPSGPVSTVLERVGGWMQRAQSKVKEKMD